jgi:hypothetical protein
VGVAYHAFADQRVCSPNDTGETLNRPADLRVDNYRKGSFRAILGDGDYGVTLRGPAKPVESPNGDGT